MIPPASTFFNLIRNFDPIKEQTMPQIASAFGAYGDKVLLQFKKFYVAKNSSNPVENLSDFFANLDKELSSFSDTGIIAGWVQFFKYQSPKVRTRTIAKLGKPQFLDRNFPNSANHLMSAENIYSHNVTSPVPEPNAKIPNLISTGGMQLPGYIEANLVQASHTLSEIFKSNIAAGLGKLAKNVDPHMGNLVPDALHPDRVAAAAPKFIQGILDTFGSAANFMAQTLGFNRFRVENKNISSPNYKVNVSTAESQVIRVNSTGSPETKDAASLERFKVQKSI